MTFYELMLFIHIAAAILWIGAGFMLLIQAIRAERHGESAAIRRIVDDGESLGKTFFVPASGIVLAAGIVLTIDGPWSFDQLWIVIGLLGFAATFSTGLFVIEPRMKLIGQLMEREGGFGPAATAEARRLLVLSRLDYVVLFVVVPTWR
jgi:uncharacterized membrane protein